MKQRRDDTSFEPNKRIKIESNSAASSPEQFYIIPNKLHCIWLGDILTEKGKANLLDWRKKNPDYEINLWIHSMTYFKFSILKRIELNKMIKFLLENNINIIDINPKPNSNFNSNWRYSVQVLPDFVKDMPTYKYFLDELNPAHVNYAAASDILRFYVLATIGGIYADIEDVTPGEHPLGELRTPLGHLMPKDHYNNDFIASIPNGEGIKRINTKILRHYEKLYQSEWKVKAHQKEFYNNCFFKRRNRFDSTLYLAGPDIILNFADDILDNDIHHFPEGIVCFPYQSSSWFKFTFKPNALINVDGIDAEEIYACFRRNVVSYFNWLMDDEEESDFIKAFQKLISDISGQKPLISIQTASLNRFLEDDPEAPYFYLSEIIIKENQEKKLNLLNKFIKYTKVAEELINFFKENDLHRHIVYFLQFHGNVKTHTLKDIPMLQLMKNFDQNLPFLIEIIGRHLIRADAYFNLNLDFSVFERYCKLDCNSTQDDALIINRKDYYS